MEIKIINKSKEGVTIKASEGIIKLSWKDFNKKYVIVNKFYVKPNEETQKKFEEVEDLTIQAYVAHKAVQAALTKGLNASPEDYLMFSSVATKIQRLMNYPDVIHVMKLLRERFATYDGLFRSPSGNNKRSIRQQEIEEKNKKTTVKEEYNEIRSSNALGDVKGFDKLKEMFKDEETKSE